MQDILAVTVPFFALVLCGYVAARLGWLPESAIPGLNAFVLFFALPCLLFRLGAATPVAKLLDPVLLLVYGSAGLAMLALTVRLTLAPPRLGLKDAAFGALMAAFPNSGFMGLPLLTALLGASAGGPVMVTLLFDLFVTTSICLTLAQLEAGAHLPLGQRLRLSLRGPFTNPQPWAIGLGAVASASGFVLSGPIDRMVELLAGAATPVALFTIGAVLCRAGRQAQTRTAVAGYLPVALLKLVLHPLLVFGLGQAAMAGGLALSRADLVTLTLVAALPSASNVSILAERFGADNGRVARIVISSTALAFLTFSALSWWFGIQPLRA